MLLGKFVFNFMIVMVSVGVVVSVVDLLIDFKSGVLFGVYLWC